LTVGKEGSEMLPPEQGTQKKRVPFSSQEGGLNCGRKGGTAERKEGENALLGIALPEGGNRFPVDFI